MRALALTLTRTRTLTLTPTLPLTLPLPLPLTRWEALAPGVVSHVTIMGAADILSDGTLQMSLDGSNNKFDPAAASFVYSTLNADPRFWLIVVMRFAAAACQLPRTSFDGSVPHGALTLTLTRALTLTRTLTLTRCTPWHAG